MRSVTSLKPIVSPIVILVRIRRIFFSTRRTGAVRSLLSKFFLPTQHNVLYVALKIALTAARSRPSPSLQRHENKQVPRKVPPVRRHPHATLVLRTPKP